MGDVLWHIILSPMRLENQPHIAHVERIQEHVCAVLDTVQRVLTHFHAFLDA